MPPPSPDYSYYAEAIIGRSLPLAYVDLERFDANARALAQRASGKPIRLASKSVRCVALMKRVLEAKIGFEGVLAYHAREAVFLAEQGFRDILIGYPMVDRQSLLEVAEAVKSGAEITLMVDSREHVERLAVIARDTSAKLSVCIDVDMSRSYPGLHFGVRRSPLRTPEEVLEVAEVIRARPSLRLEGVMGYEAQLAGVQDAAPGHAPKNFAIRLLKRSSRPAVLDRRAEVVKALKDAGFTLRFINGGGTGSLELTAADPNVTELAAGSGLYAPLLFDGYEQFRHEPAAGFALPITRRPTEDIFTCQSGGFVASGAAGPDRLPRPVLPEGAHLLDLEGAGEVQTPVAYSGPVALSLGSPIFFRHAKAGELCEHFPSLALISNGRIVGDVPTYRGEGKSFA